MLRDIWLTRKKMVPHDSVNTIQNWVKKELVSNSEQCCVEWRVSLKNPQP